VDLEVKIVLFTLTMRACRLRWKLSIVMSQGERCTAFELDKDDHGLVAIVYTKCKFLFRLVTVLEPTNYVLLWFGSISSW
jgi:hypothetical protein